MTRVPLGEEEPCVSDRNRKGRLALTGETLSRTAHHISRTHWNVKEPDYRWGYDTELYREPGRKRPYHRIVGEYHLIVELDVCRLVLRDLRYWAGCKRTPAPVVRRVSGHNWLGHGGSSTVQGLARKDRKRTRNWERMFNQEVAKLHRASGDLDNILEPEGRTRHGAIWDAW